MEPLIVTLSILGDKREVTFLSHDPSRLEILNEGGQGASLRQLLLVLSQSELHFVEAGQLGFDVVLLLELGCLFPLLRGLLGQGGHLCLPGLLLGLKSLDLNEELVHKLVRHISFISLREEE